MFVEFPPVVVRRELRHPTKRFATRIVQFCRQLPDTIDGKRIGGQLIDSGTSIYANYRVAGRSRSRAEFISKLGIVCEEADETVGWLELIDALQMTPGEELKILDQRTI